MKMKIISCLLVGFVLMGCNQQPYKTPTFNPGDMVTMKLNGQAGMVIRNWCNRRYCDYNIRFALFSTKTNTYLMRPDGDMTLSSFSIVYDVREFELQPK